MNIDTLKSFLISHAEHAAEKARASFGGFNSCRSLMWGATENAFRETLRYIEEEEEREKERRHRQTTGGSV